jgi:hypothetical protein
MADRLMCAVLVSGFTLLASATMANTAMANPADPTQPPPGFKTSTAEVGPAGAASSDMLEIPKEAPLIVSSLFLMGAHPYAVVDGQIVRPGDPLISGKVSKIDAMGVWIVFPRSGKTTPAPRLLKWLPDVVKKTLSQPAGKSSQAPETTSLSPNSATSTVRMEKK